MFVYVGLYVINIYIYIYIFICLYIYMKYILVLCRRNDFAKNSCMRLL